MHLFLDQVMRRNVLEGTYYTRNRASRVEYAKDYYRIRRENLLALSSEIRRSFDSDYKETFVAYVERGGYRFAKESRKRGEIRRATPTWSNLEKLRAIYRRCAELNRGSPHGIEYHVLHVIPVRNKKVCGLHVDWNLRIGSRSFMEVVKFDQDQESERYFRWLKQQGH